MRTAAFILAAAFLAGCNSNGGGSSDAETTDVSSPGGFKPLYDGYLNKCAQCHAPGAMGRTVDIEQTLDFTSASTARSSLGLSATGMVGAFAACNDVPFLGPTYEQSLLAAVLDEQVRSSYSAGSCDANTITDMTLNPGQPSASFLAALKEWIDDGAQ